MSLSEQWILKDKKGNPPPDNIVTFSQKIPKRLLFPCPRTADDLEMPEKEEAPREMNNFIVFRRQLAYVAKMRKTSDDGRVISSAASFMWNGASKSDKQSYTQIAAELKRRHRLKYPNYTYERRKRKTAEEDFIVYDGAMVQSKNKKKQKKSHTAPRVNPVSKEPECVPISLPSLQEEWLFNPFASRVPQIDDNSCYDFSDNGCYNFPGNGCYNLSDNECYNISEELLPLVYNRIIAQNYSNLNSQQIQAQNNTLLQQPQQQPQPAFDDYNFLQGSLDMGIINPIINPFF